MKPAAKPVQLDADLALKGFFADPDWMFKMGLGGVINAGSLVLTMMNPFVFLPVTLAFIALVSGYLLRCLRLRVLNPASKLPDWSEWLDLFMSGLTWIAIQFGLFLVTASVATISLMLAAAAAAQQSPSYLPVAIAGVFFTVFTCLAVQFLQAFLMVNFAVEERLGAGFAILAVVRRASQRPGTFACAWLLATGLQVAAIVLPVLTVVGIFLTPSTLFASQLISASLLAQAWGPEKAKS